MGHFVSACAGSSEPPRSRPAAHVDDAAEPGHALDDAGKALPPAGIVGTGDERLERLLDCVRLAHGAVAPRERGLNADPHIADRDNEMLIRLAAPVALRRHVPAGGALRMLDHIVAQLPGRLVNLRDELRVNLALKPAPQVVSELLTT